MQVNHYHLGGDARPLAAAGPEATVPVGRPLEEVTDPFALEVHRPMEADGQPPGLDLLPAYLPRAHDRALAGVVQAAAGGASGVAVLVGGSSTGKTRACWEALTLLRGKGMEVVASDCPVPHGGSA